MADPALRLQALVKRFGAHAAVDGVDLAVALGEFVTLLGPSGCGKTTTLNLIAGFLAPDSGFIALNGRLVQDLPPFKRDLGMVFQDYALFPHMSVADNVAFGLKMRGVSREETATRVAEALSLVKLDGFDARRPNQLSGGQRQRVALARALVIRPAMLLLDEPLSNLDATLRAQMRIELRRLHRELGITTVFVTHDQAEAMALSTRVAVFDRGAVIQVGTPAEVYRRPRTRFVAEFLGAANLLSGTVQGDTVRVHGAEGRRDGLRLRVADPAAGDGAPVVCVVRPEAIQRVASGAAVANRLDATVLTVVYLGGRHECELALAGGLTLRAELATHGGAEAPKPGERIVVAIAPEDVVLLIE